MKATDNRPRFLENRPMIIRTMMDKGGRWEVLK